MRVAVTGAGGRLGSALITALADAPFTGPAGPIAWRRDAFDLDAPEVVGSRLDRDRPEVVVHAAAWTDVDACALDPDLALRRNGIATGILAEACASREIDLLIVIDVRFAAHPLDDEVKKDAVTQLLVLEGLFAPDRKSVV